MWPNPQETANLVTFTEEILNEKFHFLCSVITYKQLFLLWFSPLKYMQYLVVILTKIIKEWKTLPWWFTRFYDFLLCRAYLPTTNRLLWYHQILILNTIFPFATNTFTPVCIIVLAINWTTFWITYFRIRFLHAW